MTIKKLALEADHQNGNINTRKNTKMTILKSTQVIINNFSVEHAIIILNLGKCAKKPLSIQHIDKKLVSIFLSIPSNSFCESIFSSVNNIWTDERNRFSVSTVNALISVKCNMDLDCVDAYNFFLTQKELLDKVGHSYNC